ncbi:MAG TPA: hypothetical protein VFE38_16915 [Edaphobacter sp.]|nr:hypothetical protein [Edaphobacter sp.]
MGLEDDALVIKMEPNRVVREKRLGALETPEFALTDAFFEPLPEDELGLWNGEDE